MILSVLGQILEVIGGILVFVGAIIVTSILIVRSLKASYKDVYKYQSKFDIELRKMINLLSKVNGNGNGNGKLKDYQNEVIKELSHEEKKHLLLLIDEMYEGLDKLDDTNTYLVETFENLQEERRIRDSKAIVFNHKILMFPFNIYAKILKMKKWDLFLHQQ